jgi:hypothetical protein
MGKGVRKPKRNVRRSSAWCSIMGLLLSVGILVGCNEGWSIASVMVNPQPLGGNGPITPVDLLAPNVGSQNTQTVSLTYQIARDAGFNNFLEGQVTMLVQTPDGQSRFGPNQGFQISADRGSVSFLQATCTRLRTSAGVDSARLELKAGPNFDVSVAGTSSATANVSIDVDTRLVEVNLSGKDQGWQVNWHAPAPLPVACFLDENSHKKGK